MIFAISVHYLIKDLQTLTLPCFDNKVLLEQMALILVYSVYGHFCGTSVELVVVTVCTTPKA